jgi:hypothetical protein
MLISPLRFSLKHHHLSRFTNQNVLRVLYFLPQATGLARLILLDSSAVSESLSGLNILSLEENPSLMPTPKTVEICVSECM